MTQQEKEALIDAPCTLDGEPALVCGRLMQFATIAALNGHGYVEFAWNTVARILSNGGDFQS